MKSTITAMMNMSDESLNDIPAIHLARAFNEVDKIKTASLDSTVDSITDIIIQASNSLDLCKADILAEVIKSCLMSDDDNPNHINGIELFCKCDKCLVTPNG